MIVRQLINRIFRNPEFLMHVIWGAMVEPRSRQGEGARSQWFAWNRQAVCVCVCVHAGGEGDCLGERGGGGGGTGKKGDTEAQQSNAQIQQGMRLPRVATAM